MFDSFSEFVKPISNQTKLPKHLPFGFSVVHNSTVSKMLEIEITLISTARRAKDAIVVKVHYSLLLRFQIFIFHSLCCLSNWLCIVELHLRNRKHLPCFYWVIETRVEVCENEKCCGDTNRRRVFPQIFQVLPNFHSCFYNSIETRRTCFLFLLQNTVTKKGKQLVNSLC